MQTLYLWLDLIGSFVFALSGAMMAVRKRLDLFGVLVLSFCTASVGGIARDVLIGAIPPAALTNWHYPAIWISAGLLAFVRGAALDRLQQPVRVLDAIGLSVFAVAGTVKALDAGISPLMAPCLGMLSGIGGGILRDVLLAKVPLVLQSELYAVAALAGASVVAIGHCLHWPAEATAIAGALLCFLLRMAALRYGWHLPTALQRGSTARADD